MKHDLGYENDDIDDTVSRGGKDKQVDIVLTNDESKTLMICQAKCEGWGRKPKTLDPDKARSFNIT